LRRILSITILGEIAIVFDNLIVDIFGMVIIATCLIGLVPSRRPSRRYASDV
jgi:hypothetical protein